MKAKDTGEGSRGLSFSGVGGAPWKVNLKEGSELWRVCRLQHRQEGRGGWEREAGESKLQADRPADREGDGARQRQVEGEA